MPTDEEKPSIEKIFAEREISESIIEIELCAPAPGPQK